MGNSLCKHRSDVDASSNGKIEPTKTQSSIDKIISRVQLCPRSLSRNSELKERHNKESKRATPPTSKPQPIAPVHRSRSNRRHASRPDLEKSQSVATITPASSEWMEVALEVPDSPSDKSRLTDLIVNKGTPIPPPRKHRKKLREKIESITKNVIGGLQGAVESVDQQRRVPVVEPLVTRTIVKRHVCDIDEHRCRHAHAPKIQHQKNHSTVSLPNYDELQLSVPKSPDRERTSRSPSRNSSAVSLPGETKKPSTILETYMTRCRSFGSLLPHQILERLKSRRVVCDTAESDDSWGGLEDWDLGVIEHYKPHESSLPRPIKNADELTAPVPPVRRVDRRPSEIGACVERFIETERDHASRVDGRTKEADRSNFERIRRFSDELPKICDEIAKEETKTTVPTMRTFDEIRETIDEHSGLMKIIDVMAREINDEDVEKERIKMSQCQKNISNL